MSLRGAALIGKFAERSLAAVRRRQPLQRSGDGSAEGDDGSLFEPSSRKQGRPETRSAPSMQEMSLAAARRAKGRLQTLQDTLKDALDQHEAALKARGAAQSERADDDNDGDGGAGTLSEASVMARSKSASLAAQSLLSAAAAPIAVKRPPIGGGREGDELAEPSFSQRVINAVVTQMSTFVAPPAVAEEREETPAGPKVAEANASLSPAAIKARSKSISLAFQSVALAGVAAPMAPMGRTMGDAAQRAAGAEPEHEAGRPSSEVKLLMGLRLDEDSDGMEVIV